MHEQCSGLTFKTQFTDHNAASANLSSKWGAVWLCVSVPISREVQRWEPIIMSQTGLRRSVVRTSLLI
jgi:hypothetical protein